MNGRRTLPTRPGAVGTCANGVAKGGATARFCRDETVPAEVHDALGAEGTLLR